MEKSAEFADNAVFAKKMRTTINKGGLKIRLIDADALENNLCVVIRKHHSEITVFALYMMLDIIRGRNTIEAEPVKQGEWLDVCCKIKCSCCGEEYSDEIFCMGEEINYCPNCDAKMDSSKVR